MERSRTDGLRIQNYLIKPASRGWVVSEIKTHGPESRYAGQEYEANPRYPGTFDAALALVLDRLTASSLPPSPSLTEAVTTVAYLYATIGLAAKDYLP